MCRRCLNCNLESRNTCASSPRFSCGINYYRTHCLLTCFGRGRMYRVSRGHGQHGMGCNISGNAILVTSQATIGFIFVALALTLCFAAWRGRNVPWWLPFASPLFSMSILPPLAMRIPAPLGLPVALMSSSAGECVWLILLYNSTRK